MTKYAWRPPVELREGEPWFFLRAQDRYSAHAVAGYAQGLIDAAIHAEERGDEELAEHLRSQAKLVSDVFDAFRQWQEENVDLVKTPD